MIYLDNASTTKPSDSVKKVVLDAMDKFGNPSSMHRLGIDAEDIIKKAKENASEILHVSPNNIYFTSGGTESNNTAIFGAVKKNAKRGKHIITTKVEHPSVLTPFKMLEGESFEVSYIGIGKNGTLDIEAFENSLREDTIFVSVMHVNNETGTIMPVDILKGIMKKKSPKALLHVDSVQGFGKVNVKPKQWGIDLLSASGHKIHGLKGTGILYIADNVSINPYICGGGQQKNMRSGTENVVGISAFSKACEDMKNYNSDYVKSLRDRLKSLILENIDRVKINEAINEYQAGHILNVSFAGIRSEILLHSLEMHDIYVSTGSACSTNKPMPSHVLQAIGCTASEIDSAVRFSFSQEITEQDIEKTISALIKEVTEIRKYTRK